MPNFRRAFVPGGTFFFTVVTNNRIPLFEDELARTLLGQFIRETREKWPFEIDAIVLLPDHLHAIWTLPSGDTEYSKRWGWLKKEFSKCWISRGGRESDISESRRSEQRLGIWQPRFWEHTILDEHDFEQHFDYIHFNPVKHGYVRCPHEWPHSSFHRWVEEGVYPQNWACGEKEITHLLFEDIASSVGE